MQPVFMQGIEGGHHSDLVNSNFLNALLGLGVKKIVPPSYQVSGRGRGKEIVRRRFFYLSRLTGEVARPQLQTRPRRRGTL